MQVLKEQAYKLISLHVACKDSDNLFSTDSLYIDILQCTYSQLQAVCSNKKPIIYFESLAQNCCKSNLYQHTEPVK